MRRLARWFSAGGGAGSRGLSATNPSPRRVLFVFLDGVGLGSADPDVNPLAAADLPTLRELAGGEPPLLESAAQLPGTSRSTLRPLDATFALEGLPQSGTGQTAILCGVDAPGLLGRHFGPWVPTALRPLLASRNFLRRAQKGGARVAFANAYPSERVAPGRPVGRRPGAIPFAAEASGLLIRDETDLREGRALVSSITTDGWRRHVDPRAPLIHPASAGRLLASIAGENDLTFFAHFDTDYVGHRGAREDAIAAVERVDRFLGGLVEDLPGDALLVLTSDHGNIEDVRAGHTLNPVPLLIFGPGHEQVIARAERISDLAPIVLERVLGYTDPRKLGDD